MLGSHAGSLAARARRKRAERCQLRESPLGHSLLQAGEIGQPGGQDHVGWARRGRVDHQRKRPWRNASGFSSVFRRTVFVPRTHTFCENRSRLNDGRQNGLKGSASKERFTRFLIEGLRDVTQATIATPRRGSEALRRPSRSQLPTISVAERVPSS